MYPSSTSHPVCCWSNNTNYIPFRYLNSFKSHYEYYGYWIYANVINCAPLNEYIYKYTYTTYNKMDYIDNATMEGCAKFDVQCAPIKSSNSNKLWIGWCGHSIFPLFCSLILSFSIHIIRYSPALFNCLVRFPYITYRTGRVFIFSSYPVIIIYSRCLRYNDSFGQQHVSNWVFESRSIYMKMRIKNKEPMNTEHWTMIFFFIRISISFFSNCRNPINFCSTFSLIIILN